MKYHNLQMDDDVKKILKGGVNLEGLLEFAKSVTPKLREEYITISYLGDNTYTLALWAKAPEMRNGRFDAVGNTLAFCFIPGQEIERTKRKIREDFKGVSYQEVEGDHCYDYWFGDKSKTRKVLNWSYGIKVLPQPDFKRLREIEDLEEKLRKRAADVYRSMDDLPYRPMDDYASRFLQKEIELVATSLEQVCWEKGFIAILQTEGRVYTYSTFAGADNGETVFGGFTKVELHKEERVISLLEQKYDYSTRGWERSVFVKRRERLKRLLENPQTAEEESRMQAQFWGIET